MSNRIFKPKKQLPAQRNLLVPHLRQRGLQVHEKDRNISERKRFREKLKRDVPEGQDF